MANGMEPRSTKVLVTGAPHRRQGTGVVTAGGGPRRPRSDEGPACGRRRRPRPPATSRRSSPAPPRPRAGAASRGWRRPRTSRRVRLVASAGCSPGLLLPTAPAPRGEHPLDHVGDGHAAGHVGPEVDRVRGAGDAAGEGVGQQQVAVRAARARTATVGSTAGSGAGRGRSGSSARHTSGRRRSLAPVATADDVAGPGGGHPHPGRWRRSCGAKRPSASSAAALELL